MFELLISGEEYWDEENEVFIIGDSYKLQLEHSLLSVSKWEAKYNKCFLSKSDRTLEETIYYIKCMTVNKGVPEKAYNYITQAHIWKVNEYVNSKKTATYVIDEQEGSISEKPTAELIYYWMIAFNIPFDCQKWHLDKLITLIKVCNAKNKPAKKGNAKALARKNAALNAARKKRIGTKG